MSSSSSQANEVPLLAAPPPSLAWGTSPSLYLSYGIASLQGRRAALTDAVAAAPSFTVLSPPMGLDYFAVFDGHDGTAVAKYLQKRLGAAIAGLIEHELMASANPRFLRSNDVAQWWNTTIQQAFWYVDNELTGVVGDDMMDVGATALVVLVLKNYLVLANCGFSKAVVSCGGEAVVLSPEHQEDMAGLQKLMEMTGCDLADAKLLMAKQTARVFGSALHKADEVEMMPPEVISVARELGDEFLILASDGVWESVTPAAACAFVRQSLLTTPSELDARGSPTLVAKELAEHAIDMGSQDNVSVILVLFKDFWTTTNTATESATEPPKTVRRRRRNVRLAGPEWDHCG
ncbi:hypothetical protein QOZ80_1BG0050080 [Eleusine coracana subsp. coracana]|nr:hypothetical protein QOZ80_1BG0050080 [Eleusine coracana subsp. coracana]